ncbi:MAG: lysine--tRNA ligase [Salinisphaeraceae bacterium]
MNQDNPNPAEDQDEHRLIAARRDKLTAWRETGGAFPNDFRPANQAGPLVEAFGEAGDEGLEAAEPVTVAGRLMAKRVMGKASFAQLQDGTGRIQLFVQRDAIGEEAYRAFKAMDVGDILGAAGQLMRTRTGELSIRVDQLQLLTKSLRPLPEKWHGLSDTEARYRQRYLDLIMHPESRAVFTLRSRLMRQVRRYFDDAGFAEVETPMLQAIPGGAAARPFVTHYNALDHDFYLRIAPELFLKRLVVGGMDRVYELNRNFRNEGVSTRHNPEFTMLEFYQAYADHEDLMRLIEGLIERLATELLGSAHIEYQGEAINLAGPYRRLPLAEAIVEFNPDIQRSDLDDDDSLERLCRAHGITPESGWGRGKRQTELFEKTVEHRLHEPTFITDYPAEVSPLARRRDDAPELTERFELFIAGREVANGFSELNDPEDQAERLRAQAGAKDAGDDEAMYYDADYVEALEYGLPPTAGAGIGIDRLVMFLADRAAIRDVLLFPQLRPRSST